MFWMRIHHTRFAGSVVAVFLGAVLLAAPAVGQQVLVGEADTVRVANGGVWHLQGGTMDFGGPDATASLVERGSGRVTGGQLTATRSLNGPNAADVAGLGAVLSASADLGDVTVTRGHTAQSDGSGNESIERFYHLSATGTNSGLSATLTHHYADAELNGLSESNLELFTSDDGGSTWDEKGVDSRDASANTVTLSGISSFSRWTLGSTSSPLPVELAAFRGRTTEKGVRLTWRTASERNNAAFRIQRKALEGAPMHRGADQVGQWTTVGRREGGGTTDGPQTYRFADTDLPYAADVLTYRLKQVDVDGTARATDPITVERGGVERLALKKTFPNPAESQVTVRYAVPEETDAESVRMRLYDVLGRRVQTVTARAASGRHERQLSVRDLASGVYVLRLRAGEQMRTRRLTVVR